MLSASAENMRSTPREGGPAGRTSLCGGERRTEATLCQNSTQPSRDHRRFSEVSNDFQNIPVDLSNDPNLKRSAISVASAP